MELLSINLHKHSKYTEVQFSHLAFWNMNLEMFMFHFVSKLEDKIVILYLLCAYFVNIDMWISCLFWTNTNS